MSPIGDKKAWPRAGVAGDGRGAVSRHLRLRWVGTLFHLGRYHALHRHGRYPAQPATALFLSSPPDTFSGAEIPYLEFTDFRAAAVLANSACSGSLF